MMRVLNGWQRLWIVVCFVLLGFIIIAGARVWPSTERDNEIHRLQVEIDKVDLDSMRKSMGTSVEQLFVNKDHTIEMVLQSVADEEKSHSERPNTLLSRQVGLIWKSLLLWTVACGMLYLAGITVRWIRRGFRPKRDVAV